ncbi:GNAT family N-acetyltransferase [Variovorax sp. LT1R16]|uniref:GNAT family N-acetyltransferase n=1 Tax=Variovorax sp. LT1R16 TaxID=3443728 RepID=UPI003F461428
MWAQPQHRGNGHARSLLAESISWARTLGAGAVCLSATVADSAAWRLYSGVGFVAIGAPEALREGSALQASTDAP